MVRALLALTVGLLACQPRNSEIAAHSSSTNIRWLKISRSSRLPDFLSKSSIRPMTGSSMSLMEALMVLFPMVQAGGIAAHRGLRPRLARHRSGGNHLAAADAHRKHGTRCRGCHAGKQCAARLRQVR